METTFLKTRGPRALFALLLSILLVPASGCGGGGGGGSSYGGGGDGGGGGGGGATTAITGSVTAGPVNAASVRALNAAGTVVAGPVTASAAGVYTINVPDAALASDLYFEATGGTFTDEATGSSANGGGLLALAPGGTLTPTTGVHLTASTTIFARLVRDIGKTRTEAGSLFSTLFGYSPNHLVAPMNGPASGADITRQLSGLRAFAFSQLTKDLGLAPEKQFDLLTILAQDLGDGALDGKTAGAPLSIPGGPVMPEDIHNRFIAAVDNALLSPNNLTGLKSDQLGALPFPRVALTTSYRVQYVPGATPAREGKTAFTLKVNSRASDAPVVGLAPVLTPRIRMVSRTLPAPVDPLVIDNGDGTYACTVYYTMPSMISTFSNGIWTLRVGLGPQEEALFFPQVGAPPFGTTGVELLLGQADTIDVAGTPKKRTWYLFPDGLSGTAGNHTVKVFVAALETGSATPVGLATVLHDATGAPFAVNSISLELSIDLVEWFPMVNDGSGHYSLGGVGELNDGAVNQVVVRLTVNGETKTTDGLAAGPANDHTTLYVRPGQ